MGDKRPRPSVKKPVITIKVPDQKVKGTGGCNVCSRSDRKQGRK